MRRGDGGPEQGGGRVERNCEQVGLATVKPLGDKNCRIRARLEKQALGVKSVRPGKAVEDRDRGPQGLAGRLSRIGFVDAVDRPELAASRRCCRCLPRKGGPDHRPRCPPNRCSERPGETPGQSCRPCGSRRAPGDFPSRYGPRRCRGTAGSWRFPKPPEAVACQTFPDARAEREERPAARSLSRAAGRIHMGRGLSCKSSRLMIVTNLPHI